MVTGKPFKKKLLKEITEKEYLIKRDYIWLPTKLANKKVKIELVNLADLEVIGKEKLKKIYKARPYPKKIKIPRIYLGKSFIGKRIKLKIVSKKK